MGINRFDMLRTTSDEDWISKVIADEDEEARVYLVQHNPHLTDAHLIALAGDRSVKVRYLLAARKLPDDVLNQLRSDEAEEVRVQALWNPQSDMQAFTEAVLRGKFSSSSKQGFCSNDRAVRSFDVFHFLWNTVRGSHVLLVRNLNYAVVENLEMINSKILNVVHAEMRGGNVSNILKEAYAGASGVARPELLDSWKDDPCRPVIDAIARNSSAWVSTQEYLLDNHKRSNVRCGIVMVTRDNCLLNEIYHGTKSKEIRYWVEKNPAFVLM